MKIREIYDGTVQMRNSTFENRNRALCYVLIAEFGTSIKLDQPNFSTKYDLWQVESSSRCISDTFPIRLDCFRSIVDLSSTYFTTFTRPLLDILDSYQTISISTRLEYDLNQFSFDQTRSPFDRNR